MATKAPAGLEGVIAADSSICFIDGQAGILSYRGYNIHTLAANATFEEVVFLLWEGSLPNEQQLGTLKQSLIENSSLPDPVVAYLSAAVDHVPMDVLRTAVSMLSHYDPDQADSSLPANRRKATRLVARTAAIVAAFERLRRKQQPCKPLPELSFAANFLYMLTGQRPDPVQEKAMDLALILHADHEFNASTFAARVTAATLSDIYSAVTSAIGALKGPLHGGANEAVIRMLLKFSSPEEGLDHVRQMLSRREKVPGFGHRVYKTEDPRAVHLRALAEKLARQTGNLHLYQISRAIEIFMKKEKRLNANVDFYSASAYYCMGIPIDLYTPIFAVSRMSGWTAHILEQYANNRLIRPRASYVGPEDGRPWIPLSKRP